MDDKQFQEIQYKLNLKGSKLTRRKKARNPEPLPFYTSGMLSDTYEYVVTTGENEKVVTEEELRDLVKN